MTRSLLSRNLQKVDRFSHNEDVYVDLDAQGHVVSITIEHAQRNSKLPDVLIQEFDKRSA